MSDLKGVKFVEYEDYKETMDSLLRRIDNLVDMAGEHRLMLIDQKFEIERLKEELSVANRRLGKLEM